MDYSDVVQNARSEEEADQQICQEEWWFTLAESVEAGVPDAVAELSRLYEDIGCPRLAAAVRRFARPTEGSPVPRDA